MTAVSASRQEVNISPLLPPGKGVTAHSRDWSSPTAPQTAEHLVPLSDGCRDEHSLADDTDPQGPIHIQMSESTGGEA